MNVPKVLVVAFMFLSLKVQGQVVLRAGESFSHQFATLPFSHNSAFGIAEPSGTVFLYIAPTFPFDLGPTNSFKVEIFENTLAEAPILSRTISSSSSIHDTDYRVPQAWGDLQGGFRVTALTGFITLHGFSLQAFKTATMGFDVYATGRIFLPAPPILSLVHSNGLLAVRWPASATNCLLESTTHFTAPTTWQAITNARTVVGDQFSVTATPGDQEFFRLRCEP